MKDRLSWRRFSYSQDRGNCVEVALSWHKSSYSANTGGNCVEVAAPWHKSSYSTGGSANCVECRTDPERVLVRDTQHRQLGHLDFGAITWAHFLSAVRRSEV